MCLCSNQKLSSPKTEQVLFLFLTRGRGRGGRRGANKNLPLPEEVLHLSTKHEELSCEPSDASCNNRRHLINKDNGRHAPLPPSLVLTPSVILPPSFSLSMCC